MSLSDERFDKNKSEVTPSSLCVIVDSERQKYGINSLKIKQNFFQKNLCTGQFQFIKIHVLVSKKIPSSHLFSSYDVIDSFFKWKLPIFFLDSHSPFNCINGSIKILLSYIRKFLRKKKIKLENNI
jgi:hypothetical protein